MARKLTDHEIQPEVCKAIDILAHTSADSEDQALLEKTLEEFDQYFKMFVKPTFRGLKEDSPEKSMICFHYGEILTGLAAFFLSKGGFQWGLAHGEGFCNYCKWPARAHHHPTKENGEELFNMRNVVLQYHPDYVTNNNIS